MKPNASVEESAEFANGTNSFPQIVVHRVNVAKEMHLHEVDEWTHETSAIARWVAVNPEVFLETSEKLNQRRN